MHGTRKEQEAGPALAGVAQWIDRQPVNLKVTGSVLSQGICRGCGPAGGMREANKQPIHVPLPSFPSL